MLHNWIDIFCLCVFGLFLILGLWSGLLKSLFRLAAWAAGALGAFFAKDIAGDFLRANFQLDDVSLSILCAIAGFLIPFLLISIIGHFLDNAMKSSSLSGMNRLGGGVFGLFKALILCALVLSVLHVLPLRGELKSTRNASTFYSAYRSGLHICGLNIPDGDTIEKQITNKVATGVKTVTDEVSKTAVKQAKASLSAGKDSVKAATKEKLKATPTKKENATAAMRDSVKAKTQVKRNAAEKTPSAPKK